MAILSTIKKVMPYLKTATGYVLCRLSSQAVEMDDGTTLQESYDSLNSKLLLQEVSNYNITTIKGSVAYNGTNAGYYCRTGNHVFASGHLNILNSNDATIIISLPFSPSKLPIVARAFKGTGTYIQAYGESGGLLIACGGGGSQVYFSVDYVCADD